MIQITRHADHLWIENVAVLPEQQGRGFGWQLLAYGEALALADGLPEAQLLTHGDFTANIELYERAGYRTDRIEPFMEGTTVYMRKRLL